jgi:hypothetical protein
VKDSPSSPAGTVAENRVVLETSKARVVRTALTYVALVLAALSMGPVRASDGVSIALEVTVVPVCRFFTSAFGGSGTGVEMDNADGHARVRATAASATLTYACSNGTAAAFTFAVPSTTNVACADCSDIPLMFGTMLKTSLGTQQGLGFGHDKTLTLRMPFVHATYEDMTFGGYLDTIILTVSP